MKIILNKGINVKNELKKEIDLDFDKLTGSDFIAAEKEVRQLGDQSPSVVLSMNYQAALVARIIGVPVDDVLALPGSDFKKLILPAANFLLS